MEIACSLGRGQEEPGLTLGSTSGGEDAESTWDIAKLGELGGTWVMPGAEPWAESYGKFSRDTCPDERPDPGR